MKKEELHKIVRDMLNGHYYGSLSTVDMEGYAYGSLVRYCLDETGQPIFSLSRIAEHTVNFRAYKKVSLFLLDGDETNIQESARLTVYGDMEELPDNKNLLEHFCRYFPESRMYHEELDFNFYRLHVQKAHYVGGFAKAHKLKDSAFLLHNPLREEDEAGIIGHMNEDHADAVLGYCEKAGITVPTEGEDITPLMTGIDQEGCHVRIGKQIYRIPFHRPVTDRVSAREVLVEMVGMDSL